MDLYRYPITLQAAYSEQLEIAEIDGVLVGTHAYRSFSAILRVRLDARLAVTGDFDVARSASVPVAVT